MEMPKDVKGKTVDIETVDTLYRGDGMLLLVDSYVYSVERDGVWSIIDGIGDEYACESLFLDPPDSWEKLERDATDLSPCEYAKKRGLDAEYAFGSAMAQDIYRRARALAGDGE